jgi:hypothetical protein
MGFYQYSPLSSKSADNVIGLNWPLDVHVVLECVPPALAIWFEIFTVPTKNTIEAHADAIAKKHNPTTFKPISGDLQNFAEGALSVYSIVPTALAVIATVLSFHNNTLSLLCIFAVIAVAAILPYFIGRRRLHELTELRVDNAEPDGLVQLSEVSSTKYISRGIRFVNIGMIVIILLHGLMAETNAPTKSHAAAASPLAQLILLQILILATGTILMLFGRGIFTACVGALAIIAVLALGAFLHINGLSKSDTIVIVGNATPLASGPDVRVEKLVALGPFPSNEVALTGALQVDLAKSVCQFLELSELRRPESSGLLIVVGAVDRLRLGPDSRRRYGSDMGMAQARAETVKAEIFKRCAPGGHVATLTLVNGPRTTDQSFSNVTDVPADRTVEVWAVWQKSVARQK